MDMPSSGFALQGQLRRGWKWPCCVLLQVRMLVKKSKEGPGVFP